MENFEVNVKKLKEEINHMEAIINEYEECIELIGHLMRMFNKEGYWDFKDRILVIYNQASRNEHNLKELVKAMNAVHIHCAESSSIEDKVHIHQESLRILDSDNTISLGIDIRLAAQLKISLDNIDKLVSIDKFIDNKGYESYNIKYNTNHNLGSIISNNIHNTTWKDYIDKISMNRSRFTYE